MNKTEKKREIIKQFLTYIENEFSQYTIEDDGDGGRIMFYPDNLDNDGVIEYHRNNGLCSYNWAPERTKLDMAEMEKMLNKITEDINN